MATADIVKVYEEQGMACMEVQIVAGEPDAGRVYTGRLPVAELSGLTNSQKKAALQSAVKALRDAQPTPPTVMGSITGKVTL